MNSYCIYLRKSRSDAEAEAHGEGETLARHERTLVELSKKMNISVTQIYREVLSGETIAARPVMQKLLSEVEQGVWDGVIVMEIERLARGNTIDQGIVAQTFKISETKIITPTKIYDPSNEFDEEYFEFGLFMSRREYKTINRRLQRGRIASVKEGKYVANQPPYGYTRKKLENDKGFTLEPLEKESEIVKLIFKWYSLGELQSDGSYKRLGTGLISNKLNFIKVPPKKGNVWSPSTIRDILINPVYTGKLRWNWRPAKKKVVNGKITIERPRVKNGQCILVNGIHPPIIDQEIFDLVQSLMSKNPPRPVCEKNLIKNPLAGIVICGKCGRKMVRKPYKDKNQPDTLICAATTCNNVSTALYYVEDRIIQALDGWLKNYKLSWNINIEPLPDIKSHTIALKNVKKEIEKTEVQISKLHDLLEQGIYSTEVFLERSSINSKKLKKLKKDKTFLENSLNMERERNKNKKEIIPKVEKILEVYKKLKSPESKNDILKQVLEKVVYTKNKRGRWHNSPDDFEIILYPKLPDSLDYTRNYG